MTNDRNPYDDRDGLGDNDDFDQQEERRIARGEGDAARQRNADNPFDPNAQRNPDQEGYERPRDRSWSGDSGNGDDGDALDETRRAARRSGERSDVSGDVGEVDGSYRDADEDGLDQFDQ